jgi:hypothetical protein
MNSRLLEAQRQLAEGSHPLSASRPGQSATPSGLISLLAERKLPIQSGTGNDIRPESMQHKPPPSGDSVLVENDGSVTYKGRKFQLYRRYAGKSVTFIEEDRQLKFSIEGKVLSKSFNL